MRRNDGGIHKAQQKETTDHGTALLACGGGKVFLKGRPPKWEGRLIYDMTAVCLTMKLI